MDHHIDLLLVQKCSYNVGHMWLSILLPQKILELWALTSVLMALEVTKWPLAATPTIWLLIGAVLTLGRPHLGDFDISSLPAFCQKITENSFGDIELSGDFILRFTTLDHTNSHRPIHITKMYHLLDRHMVYWLIHSQSHLSKTKKNSFVKPFTHR